MAIPDRSKYFINRYRFELPAARDRNEGPDLNKLLREELIDMIKGLRNKVDKYEYEMQQELKEKLKQARLINVIEMHMDMPPDSSEGHHQILSLDHATTWLGKYGPEDSQSLIVGVNSNQRHVTSRRLLALMNTALLCDTRPACRHVLQARPVAVTPGHVLSFKQIALGLPMREALKTFTEGVRSDKELWDRTDGRMMHFARHDPEIPREQYKEMQYLTAYFHTQLIGEFQSARLHLISALQREGHEKKEKKQCEHMPQSNIRRVVNVVKAAMDPDPKGGKLSPANSTDSGMAIVPRNKRKSRIPRPSPHLRRSRLDLAAAGLSASIPMMSGAIETSTALRTAGADLDRNRERTHRRSDRARHRNEEQPRSHASTRHRVHRAHRQEVAREDDVSPVSPRRPTGHRDQVVSPHTSASAFRTRRPPLANPQIPPHAESRNRASSTITQWPGPNANDKGKGKAVDKGKAKEVAPANPSQPGLSRPRRDTIPVRPPSSVYSVNPAKTGVPPPLPTQRHGSSRNTTPRTVQSVGLGASGLSPAPRHHQAPNPVPGEEEIYSATPRGSPRAQAPPTGTAPNSSPSLSIPAGVDLGAMAGGLRHNHPQRQDSRASTVRVDLDSMAGGPYVPARTNWRESQTPRPLNVSKVRSERGNDIPEALIPTASPLPQPTNPLFDRRQLRIDDSVTESNVSIVAPSSDSWSSQINLPTSAVVQVTPKQRRGRSRTPRSTEYLAQQRRANGSRFREHIDTMVPNSFNPVTNPDPSRSRSGSTNSFSERMQRL